MTPTDNTPTPEESEEFARALKPPYYAIADWRRLGRAIASRRAELDRTPSVQLISERSGIETRYLAALEDGSISLAETALVDLSVLETALDWDAGTARKVLSGEWHPPTPRKIKNTQIEAQHPWPEDVYVQGGAQGVVFQPGKNSYRTGFVEAFPRNPNSFLRGEGETIEEAEGDCWRQFEVWRDCDGSGQGHGPYERGGYTNGAGFCTKCGIWLNNVLPPVPKEERPPVEPGILDKVFGQLDPEATEEVLSTVANVDQLPTKGALDEARTSYSLADWKRLGKAVQEARAAQKMTRATLGYAIRSSGKTIARLEAGRIYSDPKTAPPGDYNSEKYMRKRLSLLETALEWEVGSTISILNGPDRQSEQIS